MPAKKFEIPPNVGPSQCKSCSAVIYWVKPDGYRTTAHPVNPDGYSHFSTCPNADEWRKQKANRGDAA